MKIYQAEILGEMTSVVKLEDYRELERRLEERDKMHSTAVSLLSENARLATQLADCQRELATLRGISQ